MGRERRLHLLTVGGTLLHMRRMGARPVTQRSFVRGEIRAVSDVAERGCGDAAVEATKAVRAPDVQDDVAVGDVDCARCGADKGLLMNLDELGGSGD